VDRPIWSVGGFGSKKAVIGIILAVFVLGGTAALLAHLGKGAWIPLPETWKRKIGISKPQFVHKRISSETGKCYDPDGVEIRCPHASFDFDKVVPIDPLKIRDNGNGTVTDLVNGLTWKRCSEGQEDDGACSAEAGEFEWSRAKRHCEDLTHAGFSDWRLPNLNELLVLSEFRLKHDGTFQSLFPHSMGGEYWTILSWEKHPYGSFVVNFNNGEKRLASLQSSYSYVRCVRPGA
jgi:hypothetical protein